ncbi:MAG: sigma-70 family RNA polymerase sigma factor [Acidobacteria bacterium]|nr:MAG: sigma-70 family RNA polymerase sigma factor [Acidobacteriota bacterium]
MIKSATINEQLTSESTISSLRVEPEFIERLMAGDAEALETFVARYINDVYKLLLRLTADKEEASDLTQETFLRAIRAIKSFRGDSELKTWLFRIAINVSNSRFRWWQKRGASITFSFDSEEVDLRKIASSDTENPECVALKKERESILIKALMKVPKKFRDAMILRDIEGFSYEEIAEILQVNLGTVKSRIARGREEFRKHVSTMDL